MRWVGFLFRFQPRLAEKKTPPSSASFLKKKKTKGFQKKQSGRWGFFPLFSVEASRENKPTPWVFSRKTPVPVAPTGFLLPFLALDGTRRQLLINYCSPNLSFLPLFI